MAYFPPLPDPEGLDAFDALTTALDDPRPYPTQPALTKLGAVLMAELLDTLLGTALEDHAVIVCETFIGGLHAGVGRLTRLGDQARDRLERELRDFDGGEVADVELQQAKRGADAADVAVRALELVRDAAAAAYLSATGEAWSPWRGGTRPSSVTAAQIDAKAALHAIAARRRDDACPQGPVVAFRGAPAATAPEDASRVFDALNWARGEWPDMALAITGAPGAERFARSWAMQKRVRLVLARPDFDRHGRAAPFRANDELLALEPVCAIVLTASLAAGSADARGFGPALDLAARSARQGARCIRLCAAAPAG